MPLFSYVARNAQGEQVRGTVEAVSLQAARSSLQEMDLLCEELYEMPGNSPIPIDIPPLETHTPPMPLPKPPPTMGFRRPAPLPETLTEKPMAPLYFPLVDTLRFYAGWLFAWYFLIYVVGSYQELKDLPFRIEILEGLYLSPIVLSFTLGAFLYLLGSDIHRKLNRGVGKGLLLSIAGLALFIVYRLNI
jgi:hypothetical protein